MAKDMTEGKIPPLMVNFTIPLILGNLFQLLYNAVDSVIVGKMVGEDALAAVGTSNPVMTLAILFINGLCIGAGVLMGMYFGAKDMKSLEKQISSTMIGGLIFSLLFSLLCILAAPGILHMMQTQADVMDIAVRYLRIVLCGLIFSFIYNFYSSVLRAMGDSKTPLYFLVTSAILNIFGDLFFVMVLKWGSDGCGIATVISEALCCLFCGIYIKFQVPLLCLGKRWLVFDRRIFKKTVSFGWASAMQQGTVQLGKIVVQSLVNSMGVTAMAAFAVVNRIDDFAYVPMQNIGHATASFLAQNKGAKKTKRIWAGFGFGMKMELVYGILICAICFFFARPLMLLFVNDAAVVEMGVMYLHLISWMYFFPALTNGIQGFFRGIGDLKVTLISSMVNMGGRLVFAFLFIKVLNYGFESVPWSCALGWICMLFAECPLLWKQFQQKKVDKNSCQ